MIHVTVWNEFRWEKTNEEVKKLYPDGMHQVIAKFLECEDITVRCATLDEEDCGLTDEIIEETDVMIWWGHMFHHEVPDELAVKIQQAVLKGMGIIFLHSSHNAKPFHLLMGTPCNLNWRVDEENNHERLWVCAPYHPIVQGVGPCIELEQEEVYGEPFGIPEPDQLIMIGWYRGGEVFRSGCCYQRGAGKVFYFQPGHETYPTFYHKDIQQIIRNAVYWARKTVSYPDLKCNKSERLER